MKREFLIERQGKSYVLYAGLLDCAHQQGLKSIKTDLVQVPSKENNHVAIVLATVTMERDGIVRTFSGIGDAAPNNVALAMQTCLVRMAETRAKARALRDAVNIGVTAFEELDEADAQDGAPERGYPVFNGHPSSRNGRLERTTAVRMRNSGANSAKKEESTSIPAELHNPSVDLRSEDQANAVRNLCRRLSLDPDTLVREKFEAQSLAELTRAQAGELIRALSAQVNSRAVV